MASLLFAATAHADAQTAQKFYASHSINIIVPYAPGGYYDIGARLVARYLGKHVAGHPDTIVQNQASAGGIGLARRFAAGMDNDGATLGVLQRAVPQYALVGYQNASFDPLKLTWIGSVSSYANDSYVLIVNAKNAAKTVADLQSAKQPTRLGAGRSGSANLLYALVAKDALRLNISLVRGYDGTAPIFLAEQGGEVDGLMADLSTIKVAISSQWKAGEVTPVVQFGRKTRLPELKDTPTARELVTDPNERSLLDFSESPFFIALPIAAPANTPADRTQALRDGFMAMAKDPDFLAEAKKMNFEVSPISGEDVAKSIADAAQASPDVKARFKTLINE